MQLDDQRRKYFGDNKTNMSLFYDNKCTSKEESYKYYNTHEESYEKDLSFSSENCTNAQYDKSTFTSTVYTEVRNP